ncbi:hypothetical protein B0H67DRAFT_688153 [Lasiosphaeris hirsuta]|uniref:Uncharacterized protein n=1 Tax=Lasiosphaeris hirsuta TaxID=260670 RepID=A0AA39ZPQ3_9PEZI|nr:hypothetical protein B0H67DRAFT_688153 [Lasiosphaeris hirsuta]
MGRTVEGSKFRARLQVLVSDARKILIANPPPMTCGSLLSAIESIGEIFNRASTAGVYCKPQDRPLRTPAECLAALSDALEAAETFFSSNHLRLKAIQRAKSRVETARLSSKMDMQSVILLLETTKNELGAMGLSKLRDKVCSLATELKSHGARGPPLTRLLDDVYGRVWESVLNVELIADMPPQVIEVAVIIQREFSKLLNRQPADQPVRDQVEFFLSQFPTTGYESASSYLVVLAMFNVMKHSAPSHSPWIHAARARYHGDIVPLKGRRKFQSLALATRTAGGGITLAHHPQACEGGLSTRPVLNATWDLDRGAEHGNEDGYDTVGGPMSLNMHSIRRGVPYATGISGYMHLLCSFLVDIRDETGLDIRHAVLGMLAYLAYNGGHAWNEGLQTVYYLEGEVTLGVFSSPEFEFDADPLPYVADYNAFIDLFADSETGRYLRRAVQRANDLTISYRRKKLQAEHDAEYLAKWEVIKTLSEALDQDFAKIPKGEHHVR